MTAALEGGEWSAARLGSTLPPGKTHYSFSRRLGGPQGRSGRAENLVHTGIRSRTVQPVVSRHSNWTTGTTFKVVCGRILWVSVSFTEQFFFLNEFCMLVSLTLYSTNFVRGHVIWNSVPWLHILPFGSGTLLEGSLWPKPFVCDSSWVFPRRN